MIWWEERKHIFAREIVRLNREWPSHTFKFEIKDELLWLLGVVELKVSNGNTIDFAFELKYPQNYPFSVPYIYPKGRGRDWVPEHQFISSAFCLDIRERSWNSTLTAVDIIKSLERLLKAQLKRLEQDTKFLDVYEEPEPTKLDRVTKDVKAVVPFPYVMDQEATNGVFRYHSTLEFYDNRVIVVPPYEKLTELIENSYFQIWCLNIFSKQSGLWFRVKLPFLQTLVFKEDVTEFKSLLIENNIISATKLEEELNDKEDKYFLFFVNAEAVLLTKMNLKEGKVQHFGCYNQDLSLLQKRLPSLTPQTDTDQKVTIIGCGSAGSFIAEELVKSGIRNLVLIDDDYVTVENVFRHSCNLADTGMKKIHALQRKLLKINPLVNIESIDTKIRVINAETEEKIKNSTLIINATANIEEVVNEFCWRYKIPSIYSIVYPEGFGGEVLRVLPGSTPCFECMNFHIGQMLKSMPGFEEFPNNKFIDYNKTIEGEIIATPALSADIKFVALFVVKFALEILRLKKEVLTDNSNVILWGNDKKWIFTQAHECLKIDTSNFQPLRNCVVCFGNEQIEREIGMNANEMRSMIDSIEITNGKN